MSNRLVFSYEMSECESCAYSSHSLVHLGSQKPPAFPWMPPFTFPLDATLQIGTLPYNGALTGLRFLV